jgi:hypothetical protein
MKNFRVQIRAYGYYADFQMKSEDNSKAFENALVDKLGKNDIKWEKDGFSDHRKIREVVNQIKQEEAKLANLANKIEDAAPSVSVAT